MRAVLLGLLLVTATWAGCLSGQDGADEPRDAPEAPDGPGSGPGSGGNGPGPQERGTPAPSLDAGQAWTYATEGLWHAEDELTIVVARAGQDGYLLAGADQEDLQEEALWDRPWQGVFDADLAPTGDRDDAEAKLFDFPLRAGKTWSWGEATVQALGATVSTPNGQAPGFLMTRVQGGNVDAAWTYAPSVGYLTSFVMVDGNTTLLSLNLTSTSSGQSATWFEPGPASEAGGAQPDGGSLMVPAEASHVVAAATGTGNGTAVLTPSPLAATPPFTHRVAGEPSTAYQVLPAGQGPWTLSTQPAGPESSILLRAVAVTVTSPG